MKMAKKSRSKTIETLKHDEATAEEHPHGGIPVRSPEG